MSVELSEGQVSWQDLLEASRIQFAAFDDFNLDQWIRRRDEASEQDLISSTRTKARLQVDEKYKLIVARIDGKVVGYSAWMLPKRCRPTPSLSHAIWSFALGMKDRISDYFYPTDPRIDPARLKIFRAQQKNAKDRIMDDEDNWFYLCILVVDPKYQRRGIGGRLIQWGLSQAKEGGERAYLESSAVGDALYMKHGFKEAGSITVGGPDLGGGSKLLLKCFVHA